MRSFIFDQTTRVAFFSCEKVHQCLSMEDVASSPGSVGIELRLQARDGGHREVESGADHIPRKHEKSFLQRAQDKLLQTLPTHFFLFRASTLTN